jgi:hypothetical protein
MHSFEVSLGYESVDRSTFSMKRGILLKFHWGMKALIELHFQHEALLKMYFGQRFHTPMKLQKNAFNSYHHVIGFRAIIDFQI